MPGTTFWENIKLFLFPYSTFSFARQYISFGLAFLFGLALIVWLVKKEERLNFLAGEQIKRGSVPLSDTGKAKICKENLSFKDKLRSFINKVFMPDMEKGRYIRTATMAAIYIALFNFSHYIVLVTEQQQGTFTGNSYGNIVMVILCLIIPIAALFLAFLTKQRWGITLDLVVIQGFFYFAATKVLCALGGCCIGFLSDFGFYSPGTQQITFPVEIIEFSSYLIPIIIGVWMIRKWKGYIPGQICSVIALFASATRVGVQFLRRQEYGEYLSVSKFGYSQQLVGLFGVLLAIVWWFIVPHLSDLQFWFENKEREVFQWIRAQIFDSIKAKLSSRPKRRKSGAHAKRGKKNVGKSAKKQAHPPARATKKKKKAHK